MEIRIKYPDITADEYLRSLTTFNSDIATKNRNLRLMIPRVVVQCFLFLFVIIYLCVFRVLYFRLVYWFTAKDELIIIFSLLAFVFLLVVGLIIIYSFVKARRGLIIQFLGGAEYEEKYSLSEYVDRRDDSKKVKQELSYYKTCDMLRYCKILDASVVCENTDCRVDIQYSKSGKTEDAKIASFKFPYHYNDNSPVTVVDFERRLVVLTKYSQEAAK